MPNTRDCTAQPSSDPRRTTPLHAFVDECPYAESVVCNEASAYPKRSPWIRGSRHRHRATGKQVGRRHSRDCSRHSACRFASPPQSDPLGQEPGQCMALLRNKWRRALESAPLQWSTCNDSRTGSPTTAPTLPLFVASCCLSLRDLGEEAQELADGH